MYVEATAVITDGNKMQAVKAQAGIDPTRKGMDTGTKAGSSSSYARKYALNGLFLIDDTKDADATNTHGKAKNTKKTLTKQRFESALKAVQEGTYTKQQLVSQYELTELQTKALELYLKIRCSAIGKIMTNARSKSEVLSKTCKSYLPELAIEEMYGIKNFKPLRR